MDKDTAFEIGNEWVNRLGAHSDLWAAAVVETLRRLPERDAHAITADADHLVLLADSRLYVLHAETDGGPNNRDNLTALTTHCIDLRRAADLRLSEVQGYPDPRERSTHQHHWILEAGALDQPLRFDLRDAAIGKAASALWNALTGMT